MSGNGGIIKPFHVSTGLPPLLYADTATSTDALYYGKVDIHDPFISIGLGRKKAIVVNALEIGRVRKGSDFDLVLPLEPYLKKAKDTFPERNIGHAEVIYWVAKEYGQHRFRIPAEFPAGMYDKLYELGLDLEIADGPFFPEREVKSAAEAEKIREGNRCSALGIAAGERVLRESKIKGNRLFYKGSVLTSERLKTAIETACLEAGAVSLDTIAAGGDQACDPHERGSGPIRPNELIVFDVFPRVQKTGYWGDMTRTFLKGRASDAQKKLVATVRKAQLAALAKIKAGVDGRLVHAEVNAVFTKAGFETKETKSGWVGFFHGTGHGLGLAIHEAPRINATFARKLKKGTAVTVEPGLYYPGLGGCRIEDVVYVTSKGFDYLSKAPYRWEIA